MIQTFHTFERMLNADDAPETVAKNQFIACSNMEIGSSLDGNFNLLRGIAGTKEITTNLLPAGYNKVAGAIKNEFTNTAIFFVYNDQGNHQLLMYNGTAVVRIAQNSDFETGMGLTEFVYIHNIDIAGDFLFWIIPGRRPYRINYKRLLQSGYTLPMKETVYTVARRPPNYPVTASKVTAASLTPPITVNVNRVQDSGFKFAYRYQYLDYERSTLSQHSKLIAPNLSNGTTNAILVRVPFAEKIEQDVLIIELIAIKVSAAEEYHVVKRWRKTTDAAAIAAHNAGTTQLSHVFLNDTILSTVGPADAVKPFDSVPRETLAQAIAKDRMHYCDNLEGYNTPETTSLSVALVDSGNTNDNFTEIFERGTSSFTYSTTLITETAIPLPINTLFTDFTANVGNTEFTYTGPNMVNGTIRYRLVGSYRKNTALPFVVQLRRNGSTIGGVTFGPENTGSSFVAFSQDVTASLNLVTNDVLSLIILQPLDPDTNPWVDWELSFSTGSTRINIARRQASLSDDANTLKSNSTYATGIVFYDEFLQQTDVVPNLQPVTTAKRSGYAGVITPQLIQWTLSNTNAVAQIPEKAKFYSIVKKKSQTYLSFNQHYASEIRYVEKKPEVGTALALTPTYAATHYGVAINLKELYNSGYGYQFEVGQIIYLWLSTTSSLNEPGPWEIIDAQGEYVIAKMENFGDLTSRNALFEIAVPKNADEFYYETGSMYAINNPGTVNRTFSTTQGILPGDVYVLSQVFNSQTYGYEAMNPRISQWRTWVTNAGRLQIVTGLGETRKPTAIRFSNVFLFGTRNNGLCTFESQNEEQLPLSMVSVTKLIRADKVQEEGGILLAIGQRDTVSIYLGEQEINDVSGSVFLAKSDRHIGQVNPLRGGYGTINPETVQRERGLILWLDVYNNCVIQYANNPLFPVSAYKATAFWYNWCQKYMTTARHPIPAGINTQSGEYLLSLPAIGIEAYSRFKFYHEKPRTVRYKVEQDAWAGDFDYTFEGMLMIDNNMLTFKKGVPHLHNNKDFPCKVHGENLVPRVTIAANAEMPTATKLYDTLQVVANKVPAYMQAITNDTYTQQTDLVQTEFESIENKHYASIRRNGLTAGMDFNTGLIRGEEMRGRCMPMCFEWEVTDGVNVEVVGIGVGMELSTGHTV